MIVVNGFPNGAPTEACGNVTDIVPNHNFSNTSNNDIPYLVDLSEFEDYNGTYNGAYIPGMGYYCKCYNYVVSNKLTIMLVMT